MCREMLVAPPPGWTPEQVEKFKAEWERAFAAGKFDAPPKLIPPCPLLTPETARELLRECVTIVKPGEVLAVRLPLDMSHIDMIRAREYALQVEEESGIKVAFIPGEEFGVGRPDPDNSLDNLTTEG